MKKLILPVFLISISLSSCKKTGCTDELATNYNEKAKKDDGSCLYPDAEETGPFLIVKLHFDSTMVRLDNFGNPATIPSNHSAQSPVFHAMSAHYIELAPNQFTQLGAGNIVYKGAETTSGGSTAVDFNNAIVKGQDEVFVKIPLSKVNAGTYNWLRVSLTYQNFELKYKFGGVNYTGQLASFVGFNTYITNYKIFNQTINVNSNKSQGYWGFENIQYGITTTGQVPSGGTTVPNPISASSPIPAGSCVVTGQFQTPFIYSGTPVQDITMVLNLSTNKSFEWFDNNQDGIYEPDMGDYPTDMGLRGLVPVIIP